MEPLNDPYTCLAATYDAWKDPDRYDLLADLLAKLIREKAPSAASVLDVGCGTGRLSREMVSRGFQVHGVDQSSAMVELALAKLSVGISYSVTPIENFQTQTFFDAAIATSDSFDHILDDSTLVSAFRSVRRALKPGAMLIFDALRPSAVRTSPPIVQDTGTLMFVKTFQTNNDLLSNSYTIFSSHQGKWDRVDTTVVERLRTTSSFQRHLRTAGFVPSAVLQIAFENGEVSFVPSDPTSPAIQEFHLAVAA